ncbi:mechanosensitive ion channel family protein [Qipengyuania aquimaris]|uniref:Mechanosensitive ion channel n=1 Tax=Qipengyuania aquimaris TaxID=255984 RepID=A0A9Q3XCZ7_9SPHN|nr:mechanosensitive ion channel domain-containing protein [Qipengyuania aquimaris]MBY6217345.1 mechanosensitive ion channel [Qipengyuania aquimaris]
MFLVAPAWAQTSPSTLVPQWNERSEEAREVLRSGLKGTATEKIARLEEIRTEIAAQRDRALALSRSQPFEAQVVEGKLGLLGAVPEGGESDFAAAKRTELEEELYRLRAPQRALEDSYLRSVATVALLDDEIEELKSQLLLRRGQTPLAPSSWGAFLSEASTKLSSMGRPAPGLESVEVGSRVPILLISIVVVLIGLAIATLGRRRVSVALEKRYDPDSAPAKASGIAVLRDIGALAMVLVGLGVIALASMLLVGLYAALQALPLLVLAVGTPVLIAHWLGMIIFAPRKAALRLADLGDKGSRRAVWLMAAIGFALGLETLVEYVEDASPFSPTAEAVAPFLNMLLLGGALFGLARTIERYRSRLPADPVADEVGDEDERFFRSKIDWSAIVTGAMKISAVAAVLLSVTGFGPLARFAIMPMIESLAVITLLVVIYLRIAELLQQLRPLDFTKSKNALTGAKFVLALVFICIAAPIIAVFWGVRPAEIGDFVVLLRDGVTIGGTTISIGTVFVFIGVFILGYVITRWIQRALQTMLLTRLDMDDGTKSAIVTGIGYIGVMLAFVAAVGAAGIDLSNLAIIFGALSVGIGFGLQSIVSNFVSGIIMLVERPIKEGDSIEVGGYAGIVDKISVRATRIQSFDHDDVIIPNSELIAGTVRNRTLTDRMTRIECSVGIAYDADVHKAFDILYEVAKSHERMVADPPPNVVMEQLGDSALMLRLYCFIDEVGKGITVRSEMYVEIVRRFAEAGIAIPFPQRDIHMIGKGEAE